MQEINLALTDVPYGEARGLGIRAFVLRYRSTLRRWHRRRMTERALGALSDRTLRDIGLQRTEITAIARQVGEDRIMPSSPGAEIRSSD
ncbi:MAG: DUF1127 domain-containing protein [Hyphomicrobiaceae bacterium]